jgi:hypothetical protein
LWRETYEIGMDAEPFFVLTFSTNIHLVFLYATSFSHLFAFFLPRLENPPSLPWNIYQNFVTFLRRNGIFYRSTRSTKLEVRSIYKLTPTCLLYLLAKGGGDI